jgi:hypothetical protein
VKSKTHKSKTKTVKALVIVVALILLSGMTSVKRVEAYIIVSSYHLFQQVKHELNIKQFKSNAYHPESQVTLEIFQ